MARLHVRLYGAPSVLLKGERTADLRSDKVRGLLAYLAIESGQAHRREKLAGLLWPDYTESSARTNLRRALADLRQAIGDHSSIPPHLLIGQETLQFNTGSDAFVDVLAFLQGVKDATADPDPAASADGLERAIALCPAPFLDGFSISDSPPFEEWALLMREQLNRRTLQALQRLAAIRRSQGQLDAALAVAWRQVELDPWQEGAHRQLMELLALTGQRSAALAHYETCRRLLQSELGVEPSGQTQQLAERLRREDWAPGADGSVAQPGRAVRVVGACPYRGLSAFKEEDAAFFFGRDAVIQGLAGALCGHEPTAVVVGPSGSGKSSLVFAGVLPRLRSQRSWVIVCCRPGPQPFRSLAAALTSNLAPDLSEPDRLIEAAKLARGLESGDLTLEDVTARLVAQRPAVQRVLLVVDQFEELYALCQDPALRAGFLDRLLGVLNGDGRTHSPLRLLLMLRADFVSQALAYRPMADALQGGAVMLGPMTREDLRTAISRPAEKQGAVFEPGLAERILDDVGDEPGNLPLLEFCLTLLWERQSDGWLTHTAYEEIGQAEGALARYAEEAYEGLDEADKVRARRVFLQLVRPGEGTEDTRRVATRVEVGEINWPVTALLADRRLVVTGREAGGRQETIEVAHEALIQRWERLQGWLAEERAFRTWQEALRAALRQWELAGREPELLLRGAVLGQAEGWVAGRSDALSTDEAAFIRAGLAQRERAEAEREAHWQRERTAERHARRLLAALAAVLAVAAVVALMLSLYSLQQRRQALGSYSLSLTANAREALKDGDASTALVLALAATEVRNPPALAQQTLLDAAYAPGPRWRADVAALFPGTQGPITALAIHADGRRVLAGAADGQLILWDLVARQEIRRLEGHTGRVNEIALGRGNLALSAGADAQVIAWDLATGQVLRRFRGHSGTVRAVDLSPDERWAVTGGFAGEEMMAPGEAILWDVATGQEVRRFAGYSFGVVTVRFVLDGAAVLAGSGDAQIFSDRLPSSDASAEGPGLVVAEMWLWDAATGQSLRGFEGFTEDAYSLAISPDGSQALAGSFYNQVSVVWDLRSGQKVRTLGGHREGVGAVAWSQDGRRGLTGSFDDSAILWDMVSGQSIARFDAHEGDLLAVALSPDGRTALSSAADGALIQWDLVDAAELQRLPGHDDTIWDVTVTRDGTRALSSSGAASPNVPVQDASIRLWDLATSAQTGYAALPVDAIMQVAISPDQTTALVGTNEPFVRIWDLAAWQEAGRLEGHAGPVTGLEFTPDGRRALSISVDGSLILWDVSGRRIVHRLEGHGAGLWALAISPDGRTALSDSGDSSMILWDLETGAELRSFLRTDPPAETGSSGMAFRPGGQTAISCEQDGLLIEWNVETGAEVRRIGSHPSLRTRIVISPDGRLAMTSGMDGQLMLWDLTTGELIRSSAGHGIIFDLALGADGRSVFFGSSDTTLVEWQFRAPATGQLRDWIAANRHVRRLDCAEQALYGIATPAGDGCE
jgi:WD40 repeat protein/DNA-binding SARP family transcriptional activator